MPNRGRLLLSIDRMGGGYQRMGEFYRSGCFLAGGNPASVGGVITNASEVSSHVSLRYWQSMAECQIYGEQAVEPICGPDCTFYELRIQSLARQLVVYRGCESNFGRRTSIDYSSPVVNFSQRHYRLH